LYHQKKFPRSLSIPNSSQLKNNISPPTAPNSTFNSSINTIATSNEKKITSPSKVVRSSSSSALNNTDLEPRIVVRSLSFGNKESGSQSPSPTPTPNQSTPPESYLGAELFSGLNTALERGVRSISDPYGAVNLSSSSSLSSSTYD